MIDVKNTKEISLKLTASPRQFELMLSRNVPWKLDGETRLVLAIISQAAADAIGVYKDYISSFLPKSKKSRINPWTIKQLFQNEAFAFWMDGRAEQFAEIIGLEPDFVVEQFVLHLGIDFPALKEINESEKELKILKSITSIYQMHDQVISA